jgi:hypothetical protein
VVGMEETAGDDVLIAISSERVFFTSCRSASYCLLSPYCLSETSLRRRCDLSTQLSSRIISLGSTQPLTEMNIRNLLWGKGRPARKADYLTVI